MLIPKMRPGLLYQWAASTLPDKTAAVYQDQRLSFAQLDELTNRIANAMLGLGLKPQDRVGVLMHNSIVALAVMQAVEKAGLVFVRLNPLEANAERRWILEDSEARLLVLGPEFAENWAAFEREIGSSWLKITTGTRGAGNAHVLNELIETASPAPPEVLITPDDMTAISYTSGTTGRPKGVVTTLGASLNRLRNDFMNLDQPILPSDVLLSVAPLTHAAGLIAQVFGVRGATNVILDAFDVPAMLEAIETERVTAVLMVPTMIVRLVNYPEIEKYDLSSLKRVYYAAAPMPVAPLKKAIALFGNIFRQQYALTENPQPVLYLYPQDHVVEGEERLVKRLGSMGRPVIGVEVMVADEAGRPCAVNEPGEIWIRSDAGMRGYWKNEAATRETITENGWLKTGDIARIDEDGYYYMADRKKDLIISGGFNVYPREVERALEEHPAVLETAVFGVPDDEWGEAVKAAVVLKAGHTVTERELIEFTKTRLARYKKPKTIEFMDALPKNTAGKVVKRELKAPHWQKANRKV